MTSSFGRSQYLIMNHFIGLEDFLSTILSSEIITHITGLEPARPACLLDNKDTGCLPVCIKYALSHYSILSDSTYHGDLYSKASDSDS